jgi:hypothetical protein
MIVANAAVSGAAKSAVGRVIERDASYQAKYIPPVITYKWGNQRKPRKDEVTWGRRLKCVATNHGRDLRAGLPWDGTSPCSAPTDYIQTDPARGRVLNKLSKRAK